MNKSQSIHKSNLKTSLQNSLLKIYIVIWLQRNQCSGKQNSQGRILYSMTSDNKKNPSCEIIFEAATYVKAMSRLGITT